MRARSRIRKMLNPQKTWLYGSSRQQRLFASLDLQAAASLVQENGGSPRPPSHVQTGAAGACLLRKHRLLQSSRVSGKSGDPGGLAPCVEIVEHEVALHEGRERWATLAGPLLHGLARPSSSTPDF